MDATAGVLCNVAGGYHPQVPAALSTWSFEEIAKTEADEYLAGMKVREAK
jgi:hypothetical protein